MRSVGELQVSGSLLVSGSDSQILGNLDVIGGISASTFNGDGSGLSGLSYYTDDDNQAYLSSIGVISSSTQIASDISGAFTSISESLVARTSTLEEFSSSLDTSFATDSELINLSTSLASDINTNDVRLTTLEGKTLISSSDQITITEAQISDLTHYTDSDTLDYLNILGIVSGSSQISYTGITDIPNGIVSSSAQLSDTTIPGSLTVGGILTAQEFHTEFVSASIIYQSGSTQFGNSLDDVHNFSGSLAVNTNNLFVSGGNVGIGTSSPASKLTMKSDNVLTSIIPEFELYDKDDQIRTRINNTGTQQWWLSSTLAKVGSITYASPNGNPGIVIWTGSTFDQNRFDIANYGSTFRFYYNSNGSSSGLNIANTGNVGIGTSSPSGKLHTVATSASDVPIFQRNSLGDPMVIKMANYYGGGVGAQFGFEMKNSNNANVFAGFFGFGVTNSTAGSETSDIFFRPYNNGASNEVLRIKGNGNVGIGTTSPTTSLHINKNSTSGASGGITIKTADSNESLISMGVSTSLGRAFISSLQNGSGSQLPLDFITGNSSTNVRMRITTDGNVGIGTSSPSSKLQVNVGTDQNVAINSTGGVARISAYDDAVANSVPLIINGSDLRFTNNTSEAVRITGGNVGIGTTSPSNVDGDKTLNLIGSNGSEVIIGSSKTDVSANEFFGGLVFKSFDSSGTGDNSTPHYSGIKAKAGDAYGNANLEFYSGRGRYELGTSPNMIILGNAINNNDGNVGIATTSPSYKLHVNGSVAGVGAYNNLSDVNYKKNINDLELGLHIVKQLRPITYNWINEEYGTRTNIGFIAQEVESVLPNIVTTADDNVKSMASTDLIPVLIKAVQEQQTVIETQEQKIQELETLLQTLVSRIETLENK